MNKRLPGEGAPLARLPILRYEAGDGAETEPTVHCPVQRRVLPLRECRGCERCVSAAPDAQGAFILCRAGDEPARALPALADKTPIAAILGGARQRRAEAERPGALALPLDASVAQAAALMVVEGVDELPVLAEDGTPAGVLSALDVMRWLVAHEGYLPLTACARARPPGAGRGAAQAVRRVQRRGEVFAAVPLAPLWRRRATRRP
jgi:hypothetical protein